MEIPTTWTFNSKEIASGFDVHVREQLPWYDLATGVICHFAKAYVPKNGIVYDIGASTGNITAALYSSLKGREPNIVSIDCAMEMSRVYKGGNELIIIDACDVNYIDYDFAACFLTLMFIPVPKRGILIEKLKEKVKIGGCLFILDKLEQTGGYLGSVNYKLGIAAKLANGASSSQILKKELSLLGSQRPLSISELDGFIEVFRYGDFVGWVYEGD